MLSSNKSVNVTRKEFYGALTVVWLYIMLVVGDLMRLESRWSTGILWCASILTFLLYSLATFRAGGAGAAAERPPLSDPVKEIARDPDRKIEAIKLYREETGAGLRESKEAVEAYIEGL
jgi:hypothetical protein